MSDTIEYLGGGSLGSKLPLAFAANASALADIEAKLAGLVALAAQLTLTPPTVAATLVLLATATAQVGASIGLPGASLSLAAIAVIIAQLEADVAAMLALNVSFGAVGVHAYKYEGTVGGFGSTLGGELTGGLPGGAGATAHCVSVLIVAEDAGAITAIEALFGL